MQDLMKWGTTNNKNQRFFRLVWVILGAVMLYEVFIYSGLGYYQYPYVRSVPLWLMKHVLIVAGVIGWLVLVAKVNVAKGVIKTSSVASPMDSKSKFIV